VKLPHSAHRRVPASEGGGRRFRQIKVDVIMPVEIAERLDQELDSARAGHKSATLSAFIGKAIQFALVSLEAEREAKERKESLVVVPNAAQVAKANQRRVVA